MSDVPFWRRWVWKVHRYPAFYRALMRIRDHMAHAAFQLCRWILPARFDFGPPKGWFSMVAQIRSGKLRGKILLEQQRAPKAGANSLRALAPLDQTTQPGWRIFWSYHHEADLIGPTLLLQDERRRIGVESAGGPLFIEDDKSYRQFRWPPAVRLDGNWTSIMSRWVDRSSYSFYHWMMDALPRLGLLAEFPADTQVIVPPNLRAYQRDTLEWLDLAERIRPSSEEHFRIEHYYFSSFTNISGWFDPYAVQFLRRSFRDRRDATYAAPRRFFVHRIGTGRGISNEDEVLDFFRARSWAIVDTQALSMAQQIQLFAQAEQICALHGAALVNLLWCEPGCRVLELVSTTFMNGVYEGIAEAVGLNYQFLLCQGDSQFKARIDLAQLEKRLDQ
jgi:capsular polysaccharide biosynthesis protein